MSRPKLPTRKKPVASRDAIILPENLPLWITPELVRETISAWQPHYRDSITVDEAVMILTRVGQLFEVLSRG